MPRSHETKLRKKDYVRHPEQDIMRLLNRNGPAINIRTSAGDFCQLVTNAAAALDIEGDEHIRERDGNRCQYTGHLLTQTMAVSTTSCPVRVAEQTRRKT